MSEMYKHIHVCAYQHTPFDGATKTTYYWAFLSSDEDHILATGGTFDNKEEAILAGQKQLRDDLNEMLSEVNKDIRKASMCKFCRGTGSDTTFKDAKYCRCGAGAMLRDQHGR